VYRGWKAVGREEGLNQGYGKVLSILFETVSLIICRSVLGVLETWAVSQSLQRVHRSCVPKGTTLLHPMVTLRYLKIEGKGVHAEHLPCGAMKARHFLLLSVAIQSMPKSRNTSHTNEKGREE
jgi:hypothetical protein